MLQRPVHWRDDEENGPGCGGEGGDVDDDDAEIESKTGDCGQVGKGMQKEAGEGGALIDGSEKGGTTPIEKPVPVQGEV